MGDAELGEGAALGARLRDGDLSVAAAVLNLVESRTAAAHAQTTELIAAVSRAALGHDAPGLIFGLTGPPGVGKSTLLSQLVSGWRARGQSVAVLAVDPSSRRSGGSLLGDRQRIEPSGDTDGHDDGTFIRSMAAGERLGGLAPATRAAAIVLAAAFDVVVIETVGVGQSETEVADLADLVAVVVQPGSGDLLQFLKAGIMEVPDLLVVTKADTGAPAQRAVADLHSALHSVGAPPTPVLPVCSVVPVSGVNELLDAVAAAQAKLDLPARRLRSRRSHALDDFTIEHGEHGLRLIGGRRAAERWLAGQPVQWTSAELLAALESHAGLAD